MSRLSEPEDSYSDDPVDLKPRRRSLQLSALSKFVLFATALSFVTVTLGANITIVGGKIEFGQGTGGIKVCVNSNNLNVAQQTAYSSGAFRLKTITIGSIPISCRGYDIIISILKPGAAGSSTLATLFGSVTKLIIYDKDGNFYVTSSDGSYVSLSSSTDGTTDNLTVTFTNPLVVNSDIGTLGVETSENTLTSLACGGGGNCPVGGSGPGGGIVIYNGPIFTAPGSPCDLTCNGLEMDQSIADLTADYWVSTNSTSGAQILVGANYHGIGNGYKNTKLIVSYNGGQYNNLARHGSANFCWNKTTTSATDRWYLPDVMEYAWIFYQVKQSSALRSAKSNWPFLTDYMTSEEPPAVSDFTTYNTSWNADSPPPGITVDYQKEEAGVMSPTNYYLAVAPTTGANGGNGGINNFPTLSNNSAFSDYNTLHVFDHSKLNQYYLLCLHAFKS